MLSAKLKISDSEKSYDYKRKSSTARKNNQKVLKHNYIIYIEISRISYFIIEVIFTLEKSSEMLLFLEDDEENSVENDMDDFDEEYDEVGHA